MSKKNKEPSTPESRAEKLANQQALRKVFTGTFFKAFAICLAALLIYSVCYIAFVNPNTVGANTVNPVGENAAQGAVVSNNGSSSSSSSDGNSTGTGDNAGNGGAAVTELTASSSQADILAYFNNAVNNVKPNAKTVTLTRETNSQAGSISGTLPGFAVELANSLISKNMGDKKDLPAPATTVEAKNAIFPVENESWASKLTADDIASATVTEADGKYTITITTKDDEPSADTAHGVGHNGKVMSIITPDTVLKNAEGAASLIKDVKTGHSQGKITVTVDKATGNVLTANYYFVWTLSLKVGVQISIPFGLEKQFTIAW